MCSGCLGREVWGTLPWQAAQMEGPDCPRTAGSVHAVPTRDSFPAGQRRPGCSSSLRMGFGERSGKWGGSPALRWPGSSEFRASLLSLLAGVTASAKPEEGRACEPVGVTAATLDGRGGTAARPPPRTAPGLPERSRRPLDSGAQFARKPTASLSGARGYAREGRQATGKRPPSGSEAGEAAPQALRAPPGGRTQVASGSFSSICASPQAPWADGGHARAARAPLDLYFPLIRSWSSLVHLNEELRAGARRPLRRELHVSARLGAEPLRACSGRPLRTTLLSSFIYFPK